ncbi:bifunctional [glutamate--ammonia ligase]-adenylyl-L-tyrosine phosphorylase/[glutamate--ammonia-ligase] adenylyltransferase [Luteimonas gilva]|uniref:Bifunctional glutamine synthetase adenylyltransferase/adenylyl-removing enzyme n=1 Tax=Luteimonas gilva TaxID=2572684 RepID=A0A4U5JN36_9GAMM|nr:bifunctional [glutamate--ammonia ligase]-adenylyl-L-tyrosine phosphorylase/[glutamate--ammonia-ligase] adenylyltransferase [Luteimonas gilva]TKR30645.1 bifunctional [glutamate--ammonia ligase]-adenylyl-L-tyrosine phosphorylase/[glutamate--ammonia-ligase] adenylyltransferase [Luteimonas gilva]
MPSAEPALDALADRALAQLRAVAPALSWSDGLIGRCRQVAIVSDFAIATLIKQPDLLARWADDDGATPAPAPQLRADNRSDWPALLRRYRTAESARLVWRDALGLDDVAGTLAGTTHLAESCLRTALTALEEEFAQRYGRVRSADGAIQGLVVFGLGKLGGGELNFSSDVDLVYAYPENGESRSDQDRGARSLHAEDYFARLGQQLAKLLDETTVDGFSHRVDLRLRPFGNAGRVALSFAAMEQYFQREGRDWERYAWLKARPVAGDIDAGERFLSGLRPFVYRRYLDYGALAGLREMKAAIAAEVARKELADDIKRGPGGIREIEFLAQALQLIRGGREPELQQRRLLPALQALVAARQIAPAVGDALADAYLFLRRLENRLQMLRDAQTHALPEDGTDRLRIAAGLGYSDWSELRAQLDPHRERVAAEFEALLATRRVAAEPSALAAYWRALPDEGDGAALAEAGFGDAVSLDGQLRDFARAPGVRDLPDAARARLDRVVPALLQAAARSRQPDAALRRVLALLQNVLRRSSYLALLDEQPDALRRLVDAVSRSALLAERVAAYPLLLDELLDARAAGPLPQREGLRAECEAAVVAAGDDTEAALQTLNEKRHALSFRIALAALDARQPASDSARQLAWLADAAIAIALRLAVAETAVAHGAVAGARFAVLGYGSLGGEELGFGSDLDLVFLYDAPSDAASDGARPLDAPRYYARLAQKLVALLGAPTAAGKLYEVDVRLRPDGAKGLLVSSLASFADYQRERAWTWEHQALVRARGVAGDASLIADFESVRAETLSRARDPQKLRDDVAAMRAKMRAELDRSDAAHFDLKQGEGGLVDLEFLLQYLVLRDSAKHPALSAPRDTTGLIRAARDTAIVDATVADALVEAHAGLLALGLACTLDRRSRRVSEDTEVSAMRGAVREAWRIFGLQA